MRSPTALLGLLVIAALPAQAQPVTGSATWLQRMALPKGAVFEAMVQDVSRADAPAGIVGTTRIVDPGQPPVAFSIVVDPSKIDARNRYAVRATVRADGRLLFTTDRVVSVLTQGAGSTVELQMVATGAHAPVQKARPEGAATLSRLAPLPASFAGDLPCADCVALRYRLNLHPDRTYVLASEYVGRSKVPFYDIGRWAVSDEGNTLQLHGGRDTKTMFRVVDARTLTLLAQDGSEIASPHNQSLLRSARFEAMQPRLKLRGMLRTTTDGAVFGECITGQRWPVLQGGDSATMLSEYQKLSSAAGGELLVEVDGRITEAARTGSQGAAPSRALLVEKFIGATPRETCGPFGATSTLLDTYWVLTQLKGQPVTLAANQREPSLVLHTAQARVAGYSGCNRLTGQFTLKDSRLSFGNLAGTMMACTEGADLEQQFLEALPQVVTYAVNGAHLELKDAKGAVLARFEARPLR